jgi:hypothetical protein
MPYCLSRSEHENTADPFKSRLFSELSNTGLKLSRIAHYVDQTILETEF